MDNELGCSGLGFADSEFESFYMNDRDNSLTIILTSWDERELRLFFSNPIEFSFKSGDAISNFYAIKNSSTLTAAISRRFTKENINNEFILYQIWDINDFPFISVVAESVKVTKGNKIIGFRY